MAAASRGEMPKKPASKSAASCTKAPRSAYVVPGVSRSGSMRRSRSQPRSVGKSPRASTPSATSRHSSSGSVTPPGKRQAIATMATGSSRGAGGTAASAGAPVAPRSPASRKRASTTGVGWSKTRVVGSGCPVSATSRLRSSTAVSESKPRSRNAVVAGIAVASSWPSTSAASSRTRSARVSSRRAGVSPASRARSVAAGPSSPSPGGVPPSRAAFASGTPSSSGRRRAEAYAGANRDQSTSATVRVTLSWSRACWRAVIAMAGSIGGTPRLRSCRSASAVCMPPSPHEPQAMAVPARPSARRCCTSASRYALPAAYPAWPALPQVAAMDE
ncbi:hypothetical protein B0E53_05954 [Micromonospora sp. MH33]|nr:hypothetical protein B0E53_05954 [Micromonospora sp. MH33]